MKLHFLDTNIPLRSISRNPAEWFKRDRAIELLEEDGGALSIQLLTHGQVVGGVAIIDPFRGG